MIILLTLRPILKDINNKGDKKTKMEEQQKRGLLSEVEEGMQNLINNSFDINAYNLGISL